MSEPDYKAIAQRIGDGTYDRITDMGPVMALLGYETEPHRRLGVACRLIGESRWQSCPSLLSADDFETWVLDKRKGRLDDIGRDDDGEHYVSYDEDGFGNDYGYSSTLGSAMWAAFVNVVGRVVHEED